MRCDCLLRNGRRRAACLAMAIAVSCICLLQQGCINSLVMLGKVLAGDPMQTSGFEHATGISLKKTQKRVTVHCSAPFLVSDEFSSLTTDVPDLLVRRMKRNKLQALNADTAGRVLDRNGGAFDVQLLAREVKDTDYIVHIKIEQFSFYEENSPSLYRGQTAGTITAFEVSGSDNDRHAVQVFEQPFRTSYPSTYPVPADQVSKSVFITRFTNHLADCLGASFYNVTASSLFAN